jgi:hypothetical protein
MRRALERLAHLLALAVLAWLLVRSLAGSTAGPEESLGARTLPAALARWSTVDRPARLRVVVDADISPAALDWLVALSRAGTPVAWEGNPPPVAAIADPMVDPGGGSRVLVAAAPGSRVALDDAFGPLDSLAAGRTGATFVVRSGPQWIRARTAVLAARSALPDSLVFGRLLLLGRVGWESKFVAAALEERGWKVDARLELSPKGNVTQGGLARLDTSRYSAVIALDSVAPADLAAIGPFLRSGGGAILSARALSAPALRSLGAARGGAATGAIEPFDTTAADPRSSLELWPVGNWTGQLTLESRAGQAAVTARRIERGRLVIVGYQDTWRWRMSGRGDGAERHRDWWAGLVASVAKVGRSPRAPAPSSVDEAPLAHLLDRFGPATPTAPLGAAGVSFSDGLLFGLLAEWASRRLRGAP